MPNEYKSEIRDFKNGDWYWINKKVLQLHSRSLKASGIAVYNALASFANSKNQTCFPTQRAIAELIGVSKRTVIRRIKELQALGLLDVKKRRGRCFYRLLKPRVTKMTQAGDKKDTREVTPVHTNNNYITRNINNIVNGDKKILNFKAFFKGFKPKTREEPESLLRKLLAEVKDMSLNKIKKGRAALFNYPVKKYAQKTSKNHRD